MKKSLIIAGIMALLLLVSVLVGTSDVVLAQGHRGGHDGKGFWANLTEEQREAVQEKKEEMRSQGATREEIHAAIAEMLKGYGIEMPADSAGPHGRGGFGPGPGGFWGDLTKEQREAVEAKIKEMKNQGSTREEIHTAVAEMLKGYGIEVPADSAGPHGRGGFGPGPGGFWKDLTKEQRESVQEKIKEMRSQNASREEIQATVAELLKGYGIELPEKWSQGQGFHPFGPGRGGFWRDLTDEQREAVRDKIKEMRSQGAKRDEIRAAVDEMIQGFGIKSPQDSENVSSGTSPAVPKIIIAQSYPNPFNPETEISFTLPENSYVSLTIYNIQGQKVKRLVNEYQPAGTRRVVWNGRDEKGEGVASGIYFYRIEAGPNTVTNRMVLLK
jgi:Spy/CpxP family protein refolding chaperone